MNTFHLDILTPYKKYMSKDITFMQIRNDDAVLGILPHHASLITNIEICKLVIKSGSETLKYAVGGGLMNIKEGTKVVLLVNSIERSDEIDVSRAEKAKDRAEKRIKEGDADVIRAKAALARALNRISVHEDL